MDFPFLQDRISRGLGVAARRIGTLTDAFRPSSISAPLASCNRYLRLSAAFSAPDGKFGHPNGYGAPLWHGVFDAAYTRPGDYLVSSTSIWFIAAQQPLLPVLCVETNRRISFSRANAPLGIGINAYGGTSRAAATPLLTDWPASVLTGSAGSRPNAELPADSETAIWNVLVPSFPGVVLRPTDLMSDDLGRLGVVAAAELTALGWRLVVKQAST